MNPFYFGSKDRALFGVHHPPVTRSPRESGVVLCCPVGQEQMRAHKAMRQVATQLAKAGFHVLRFDYFGTGDSAGDCYDGSIEQWISDVSSAVDELKDTTGISKVSLVGLRLGGALAAVVAARRGDIHRVVLWDPVVNGAQYIQELLQADVVLEQHSIAEQFQVRSDPVQPAPDQTVGSMGFPLTPAMRQGLGTIDLRALNQLKAHDVTLLVSDDREEFKGLRDTLRQLGTKARYQHLNSPGNWCEVDNFGSVLLPQGMIQGVVSTLIQE